MRISISGTPGSGKTTLARFLAKKLNLNLYMIGNIVRRIAKRRGVSIVELDKIAVHDKSIDKEIDKIHLKLKDKDNFVIDSRIAFRFFPDSIKIFLICKPEIAAKRIYKEQRYGEKETKLNRLVREIKERNKIDIIRYKKYYHVDISNIKNYDILIDTSHLKKKDLFKIILEILKIFKIKI